MAQAAVKLFEGAPDERTDNAAIDRSQLSRMTFGDQSLEREVLQLFDRQAEILMERMNASGPSAIATLAHTLKGSAVGVGASRVARAAAAAELAASHSPDECGQAIAELARSVDEARAQIAGLLRTH
jgi:HPt (histidine-containing phosphotransfer) domain-containing protein